MGLRLKLLLDTHALLWWLLGDRSLSERAHADIAHDANTVTVSAVSAMEVAIKFHSGKLPQADNLAHNFEMVLTRQGFAELPITVSHARAAGLLNIAHKDPFDRLLIAQAQIEDMILVSNEKLFDATGVRRLW